MNSIINFLLNNQITLLIIYLLVILLITFIVLNIKHNYIGNFNEASFYRILKKLYKKYDYPYIKEIILPINKETNIYYDAIVFGDKFIYIIEIKNHQGKVKIDPIDDWYYINKNKKFPFINPFYDLDLKLHVLNRYLEINRFHIIPITVYSKNTLVEGSKGNNNLIKFSQITSFIKYFESKENVSKFSADFIEKKGNYILDINVKNRKARRRLIYDLKNSHIKR